MDNIDGIIVGKEYGNRFTVFLLKDKIRRIYKLDRRHDLRNYRQFFGMFVDCNDRTNVCKVSKSRICKEISEECERFNSVY